MGANAASAEAPPQVEEGDRRCGPPEQSRRSFGSSPRRGGAGPRLLQDGEGMLALDPAEESCREPPLRSRICAPGRSVPLSATIGATTASTKAAVDDSEGDGSLPIAHRMSYPSEQSSSSSSSAKARRVKEPRDVDYVSERSVDSYRNGTKSGSFVGYVSESGRSNGAQELRGESIEECSDEDFTASRHNSTLSREQRARESSKQAMKLESQTSHSSMATSLVSVTSTVWEGLRRGTRGVMRLAGRAWPRRASAGGGYLAASIEGVGSGAVGHELSSRQEEFAQRLVELVMAVCASTADECLELAEAAGSVEHKALSQLERLATKAGLLGKIPPTASGAPRQGYAKEFSISFLRPPRAPVEAPGELSVEAPSLRRGASGEFSATLRRAPSGEFRAGLRRGASGDLSSDGLRRGTPCVKDSGTLSPPSLSPPVIRVAHEEQGQESLDHDETPGVKQQPPRQQNGLLRVPGAGALPAPVRSPRSPRPGLGTPSRSPRSSLGSKGPSDIEAGADADQPTAASQGKLTPASPWGRFASPSHSSDTLGGIGTASSSRRPLPMMGKTYSNLSKESIPKSQALSQASSFSVTSFTDFNRRKDRFRFGVRTSDAARNAAPNASDPAAQGERSNQTFLEYIGGGPSRATRSQVPGHLSRFVALGGTESGRGSGQLGDYGMASSHIRRSGQLGDFGQNSSQMQLSNKLGQFGEPTKSSLRRSNSGTRCVVELDLPCEPGPKDTHRVHFRYPNHESVVAIDEDSSEAAQTYYSACDAVLESSGGEREKVRAEVVNFNRAIDGLNQVRIEFHSQCLRTQNEWQRQLLEQQRSLLDSFTMKLEDAEREKKVVDEVSEEEKELLRGFRKIVMRQVDSTEEASRVEVFCVQRSEALRSELAELCRILEYPCQLFKTLAAAGDAMEMASVPLSRQPSNVGHTGTGRSAYSSSARSMCSYKSDGMLTSRGSSSLESPTSRRRDHQPPAQVVLLGRSWLDRELPREWRARGVFVSLTSWAEEFEEVGRSLLASSEAEIRERLRAKGIGEYLLHPLSLESLRRVVVEAVRRTFGDEYLLTKVLGRGTFGVVYRAKRLRDGAVFALKEVNTQRGKVPLEEMQREGEMLEMLEWPTIVKLVDTWTVPSEKLLYLLMPVLDGGDLAMKIAAAAEPGARKIASALVWDWYAQALHGISYLHWRGVLHQDIKPANLLLADCEQTLKISDLGNATRLPGVGPHPQRRSAVKSRAACTPLYASPEGLLQDVHMAASDVWSLGASFYEVLTGRPLFPADLPLPKLRECAWGYDQELAVAVLREGDGGDDPERRQLADELVEMLRRDPLRRPLAATLLRRHAVLERLREVLMKTAFDDLAQHLPQEHFQLLDRIISESEASADGEPPTEEDTYNPCRDKCEGLPDSRRRFGRRR